MNFWRKLFRNQRGMSMTEMVIAGGLAGAAAMGVASMMKSMGGSTKDAETVVERTEFVSALGVFLNSSKGCLGFQQGTVMTPTEAPYTTPDWTEAGEAKSWKFDGFKNFSTNFDLRYNNIKTMTAQLIDVPNVNPLTLRIGPDLKTVKKSIIKVKVALTEKSNERDPAQKRAQEDKFPESRWEYNIPVLADNSSNTIMFCGDNSTMAESCYVLKGTFDNTSGKCDLPISCESYGSYAVIDCAPKFNGVNCNDFSHGTPYVNKVTGSNSCPTGASAISTGGDNWYKNVDCGKKCTQRVNFSIGFYSCLKCN